MDAMEIMNVFWEGLKPILIVTAIVSLLTTTCLSLSVYLNAKSHSIDSAGIFGALTFVFGVIPAIVYACVKGKISQPGKAGSGVQRGFSIALLVIGILLFVGQIIWSSAVTLGVVMNLTEAIASM